MGFLRIDFDKWDRREIFQYFKGTTMYVDKHIDITGFLSRVKESRLKFYPSVIHCLASVVNESGEFRYGYDAEGNVGVWDVVDTLYTVPRRGEPGLFSMAVTKYGGSVAEFCERYGQDSARAENCGKLFDGGQIPPNVMGITAVPGLHFSSFAFGGSGSKPDLTPFAVIGKYEDKGGRVILPLCVEFAHEVNDGYHVTKFFEKLEEKLERFGG